jgi:MOSC domain-containing protein YiiM
MKIISVNVGLPREVVWKGMTVQTGIFKDPVDKPVTISKLNLAGDQQADLLRHSSYGITMNVYDSAVSEEKREARSNVMRLVTRASTRTGTEDGKMATA